MAGTESFPSRRATQSTRSPLLVTRGGAQPMSWARTAEFPSAASRQGEPPPSAAPCPCRDARKRDGPNALLAETRQILTASPSPSAPSTSEGSGLISFARQSNSLSGYLTRPTQAPGRHLPPCRLPPPTAAFYPALSLSLCVCSFGPAAGADGSWPEGRDEPASTVGKTTTPTLTHTVHVRARVCVRFCRKRIST